MSRPVASALVLETRGLSKHFGGLRAVDGVSLRVEEGRLHAVIGPNGSGKTTLFNLITGRLPPTSGRVIFRGRDIAGMPQHRVAQLGIARSYQITTVFQNLSVFENLRIGAQAHVAQCNFWRRADGLAQVNDQAERALETIGLGDKRHVPARELSHAEQRQVDLGIALAQAPTLLLLDEPTAGMSPVETEQAMRFIQQLARQVAIVLVEHKMNLVLAISDYITVLNFGQVIAEGTPEEIRGNRQVQEAYLEGSA